MIILGGKEKKVIKGAHETNRITSDSLLSECALFMAGELDGPSAEFVDCGNDLFMKLSRLQATISGIINKTHDYHTTPSLGNSF